MTRPSKALCAAAAILLAAGCSSTKKKTEAEVLLTERMAQVLLRDNRPVDAEKAFREVLKEDSKNPEVWDGLGLSLLMQGRFRDALEPLDKAVSLAPENGSYRNNRGVARMEIGEYQLAAEDFTVAEMSQNSDDRLSATINRGRLQQRQGNYKAAEQEFAMALARDPQSFIALLGRGIARESMGDFEGAAEDYLGAVKIDSRSAEANLRLGLCLVSLHKPELGRRYLERAVELDPAGDTGARARLALEDAPHAAS
jgi:tetratricopeptide (TPR) repeat protein